MRTRGSDKQEPRFCLSSGWSEVCLGGMHGGCVAWGKKSFRTSNREEGKKKISTNQQPASQPTNQHATLYQNTITTIKDSLLLLLLLKLLPWPYLYVMYHHHSISSSPLHARRFFIQAKKESMFVPSSLEEGQPFPFSLSLLARALLLSPTSRSSSMLAHTSQRRHHSSNELTNERTNERPEEACQPAFRCSFRPIVPAPTPIDRSIPAA
mmetsp:Transcript_2424/g.8139  ORF Transcript_2424/g.8139 Transcript_2424/m.8139 type:complete len:210 (-) Transcript_2424:36-665(-)